MDRNHIIMSINTEKASGQIQYLFMIKTLNTTDKEGASLTIIKSIYDKLTA